MFKESHICRSNKDRRYGIGLLYIDDSKLFHVKKSDACLLQIEVLHVFYRKNIVFQFLMYGKPFTGLFYYIRQTGDLSKSPHRCSIDKIVCRIPPAYLLQMAVFAEVFLRQKTTRRSSTNKNYLLGILQIEELLQLFREIPLRYYSFYRSSIGRIWSSMEIRPSTGLLYYRRPLAGLFGDGYITTSIDKRPFPSLEYSDDLQNSVLAEDLNCSLVCLQELQFRWKSFQAVQHST